MGTRVSRHAARLLAALAISFATILAPGTAARADGDALGVVSLDTIFAETGRDVSTLDPERVHTLLVTGDVALVRMVNVTAVTLDDFTWPFHHVAEFMRDADIAFINLEGPLVPGCPLRRTGLVFCGDPRHTEGLRFAGVDVAAIANNHMLNHGPTGRASTRDALDAAEIAHAGYGEPAIVERDGLRFGFLSYDAVWFPIDREAMAAEIDTLRDEVDVLSVMFHWGAEYVRIPYPTPGLERAPRDLARAAIDAGADLVVGNHPHWFQGVELYRGRLIAYSHGNFAFDMPWSAQTVQGMVGLYTFYDDRLIDARFVPVHIHGWGQPKLSAPEEATQLLRVMREASEALEGY